MIRVRTIRKVEIGPLFPIARGNRDFRNVLVRAMYAVVVAVFTANANSNLPLDRNFTLPNAEPFLVESEFHRMLAGNGIRTYALPRPCLQDSDMSPNCHEGGGWKYRDSAKSQLFGFSPVLGYEYRYIGENGHALNGGIISSGNTAAISFYLDARMYTEFHENGNQPSLDREFIETQVGGSESGPVAYTSYSRFRSNLSYDWAWGRLTVARDAAHWGPGLFGNLVFHQDAVPFNQVTFTTRIGPLRVLSLYGKLDPRTDWAFDTSNASHSVYAHRYEWSAAKNLILGISEQLIYYKYEAPFAFLPIVPLYIEKAVEKERLNNGNIAGDFSWRLPGIGALYSEFLIDDIQSPIALFNDNWSNKWAWTAGVHWIHDFDGLSGGAIAEYTRIEPWVYTHYVPNTAQAANLGYPLGGQIGPDALSLTAKTYLRKLGLWYLGIKAELMWKGNSPGSQISDIHTESMGDKKEFLRNAGNPTFTLSPYVWLAWKNLGFTAKSDLGDSSTLALSIQFIY